MEFFLFYLHLSIKNGGGSIMLWDYVVVTSGRGNILQVEDRMHSAKYKHIQKANVWNSLIREEKGKGFWNGIHSTQNWA